MWVYHHKRNWVVLVRSEVLTAASMKMTVFWVVAPCSLVEVYRLFRGVCCLHHHHRPDDESTSTSETSVNFYQTTLRNYPEESNLHGLSYI
jgi:hypothetical protein